MKQYQKIYILYMEARLLTDGSIVQSEFCEFSGVGRQRASKYFQDWLSVSNVPFYNKYKKAWIKAKYSKSKFFKTKKDAQDYIDKFEFINNLAERKINE